MCKSVSAVNSSFEPRCGLSPHSSMNHEGSCPDQRHPLNPGFRFWVWGLNYSTQRKYAICPSVAMAQQGPTLEQLPIAMNSTIGCMRSGGDFASVEKLCEIACYMPQVGGSKGLLDKQASYVATFRRLEPLSIVPLLCFLSSKQSSRLPRILQPNQSLDCTTEGSVFFLQEIACSISTLWQRHKPQTPWGVGLCFSALAKPSA